MPLSTSYYTHASHHSVLVHVQTGYSLVQNLHRLLLSNGAAGVGDRQKENP